jgi:hypothetical protein
MTYGMVCAVKQRWDCFRGRTDAHEERHKDTLASVRNLKLHVMSRHQLHANFACEKNVNA